MYQFAVNGQTGKVVGSYPVDKRKNGLTLQKSRLFLMLLRA